MLTGALTYAQQFSSPSTQVSILELFTSQGCEECPDSDKLLSEFQKNPALFKKVIPIAYHVDYWNDKGWEDPLSSEASTKKQYEYATIWRKPSIYTPLFALNGKPTRFWDIDELDLDTPHQNKPGILSVKLNNKKFMTVHFDSNNKKHIKQTNVVIHANILAMDFTTKVLSGTNKGKTLHNDFVSMALKTKKSLIRDKKLSEMMHIPEFTKQQEKDYYMVLWLTDSDNLIIQALAGKLN